MRYANDPRWMKAHFGSKCPCGAAIPKGGRMFYYPATRTAYCDKWECGGSREADFRAHTLDEM